MFTPLLRYAGMMNGSGGQDMAVAKGLGLKARDAGLDSWFCT